MNLSKFILAVACTFCAHGARAQVLYANAHELFVDAIRTGTASGVMTGEIAEHFSRQFHSTSTLFANARVIAPLIQPDCRRLEVIMRKADVATPTGRQAVTMTAKLNYCLDGKPPGTEGE